MKYCINIFDSSKTSAFLSECASLGYNRQQRAHLAESDRQAWLTRIDTKIRELMNWKTAEEAALRDRYMALRKLVNNSPVIETELLNQAQAA